MEKRIKELIQIQNDYYKEYEDSYKINIKKRNDIYKKLEKTNKDSREGQELIKDFNMYQQSVEYSSEIKTEKENIVRYLKFILKNIPINKFYPNVDHIIEFHKDEIEMNYEWLDSESINNSLDEEDLQNISEIRFHLQKLKELDSAEFN